jgi:transcriptional repressor NrdR
VADSRPTHDGTRRRRVCNECKRRFTTYERLGPVDIKVVKRSGQTEPFTHEKLVRVLLRICRDRPPTEAVLRRLARTMEAELLDDRRLTIPSHELAAMVLERLRDLDTQAYNRFAANYLDEHGQLRTAPREEPTAPQLGLFDDD